MNPETAILSQLIQDENLYYKMNVTREHFHDAHNRKAFATVEKLIGDGVAVDQYSLSEHLSADQVMRLHDALPTTANWSHYHSQLQEQHRKAIAADIAQSVQAQLKDGADSASIFQSIEQRLQEATARATQYTIEPIGDTLLEFTAEVEKRYNLGGEVPGITSGIPALDDLTLGFNPRRYYIVGGRPSRGKTALLLNIARHAGLAGVPVGILSLESSKLELDMRIIADVAQIESQRLSGGYMNTSEFHSLNDAAGKLNDAPIYLYDEPNMDLSTLRAQARRMVRQFGVRMLCIDYAQIVDHSTPTGKMNDAMAEVSKAFKQLARDLDVPLITAAQLTRDSQNRRPLVKDISESSQFEKDADTVILIHHELDESNKINKSYLLVEKNRDGPAGDVPVHFHAQYVRFNERVGGV